MLHVLSFSTRNARPGLVLVSTRPPHSSIWLAPATLGSFVQLPSPLVQPLPAVYLFFAILCDTLYNLHLFMRYSIRVCLPTALYSSYVQSDIYLNP